MKELAISDLISSIESKTNRFFGQRNQIFRVVLFLFCYSILHNLIFQVSILKWFQLSYETIQQAGENPIGSIIKAQSTDFVAPFKQISSESHFYKMKFRLFMPLIVKLFGIKHVSLSIFCLEFLSGFVFIGLLFKFLTSYIKSFFIAFIFLILLSTTYPISAFWSDFNTYGDAFAFLFLLISVYSNNPIIIFSVLLSAFFVDERALINSLLVLAWHFNLKEYLTEHTTSKSKKTIIIAIFGSMIAYTSIRLYMGFTLFQGMNDSTNLIEEFISVYKENIKVLGLGLWRGYKGLSGLLILTLILLYKNKTYSHFAALFIPVIIGTSFSFIAYDLSRGIGYSFLGTVFSIMVLSKKLGKQDLKIVLVSIFIATFVCPNHSFSRLYQGFPLF